MSYELWLGFALASAVLLIVPGPTVMLVISYALGGGRRTALATVPGMTLGDFTAMTLSLMGAGAVLAASATLFTLLKLVGAAYLVWLGVQLWRANGAPDDAAATARTGDGWRMFRNAYVVTALNPKSIVFFVAFVPQFVDPAQPLLPQFAVLEATFLSLAAATGAIWATLAGEMSAQFRRPATRRRINRIGGSFLIGAGALAATARRLD